MVKYSDGYGSRWIKQPLRMTLVLVFTFFLSPPYYYESLLYAHEIEGEEKEWQNKIKLHRSPLLRVVATAF